MYSRRRKLNMVSPDRTISHDGIMASTNVPSEVQEVIKDHPVVASFISQLQEKVRSLESAHATALTQSEGTKRQIEALQKEVAQVNSRATSLREALRVALFDELLNSTDRFASIPQHHNSPAATPTAASVTGSRAPSAAPPTPKAADSHVTQAVVHSQVTPAQAGTTVSLDPKDFNVAEKVLGEGRQGQIKSAVMVKTKAQCAVKVFMKSKVRKASMLHDINSEISVLGSLSHPNIIKVLGKWQDANSIYMVVERMQTDLFDIADRFPRGMDEVRIAQVARGISKALKHLHAQGICHRDLKPENIMLNGTGTTQDPFQPKLIDFGICSVFRDTSQPHLVKGMRGTIGFFAPEAASKQYFDARNADIWSFGAVVLEQLVGHVAFDSYWMRAYKESATYDVLVPAIESAKKSCVQGKQGSPILPLIDAVLQMKPDDRATADRACEVASNLAI